MVFNTKIVYRGVAAISTSCGLIDSITICDIQYVWCGWSQESK